MTQIVGIKHVQGSGEIDGKNLTWDNLVIHFISDNDTSVSGCTAGTIKVKWEKVADILGISLANLESIIGKKCDFDYVLIGSKPVLSAIRLLSDK